ncbi:MAG TPA: zf-HC2 domain-containing protein [bacterium]|nr:zf-HC2 domain-containing protein [bacterium]
MTLNHARASRLLSAYLDRELDAAETAAVQEHLLDCAVCRDAYDRLRATKALLGELPVAEPPAEFWAAVRTPQRARPATVAVRRPVFGRRVVWASAAAIVALALATTPLVKGTIDRLHASEIGVDLYVRQHAQAMSAEPFVDRAYLGLMTGDADLVLSGDATPAGAAAR